MWRVGLRKQSSAVQLQTSSSVMKNRAKDNFAFQKLLEQKDCFDLKNKIKWQDVSPRFVYKIEKSLDVQSQNASWAQRYHAKSIHGALYSWM